jgi:hypothetical protein
MKLFCIETCVAKGGKVIERGETHDTGDVPRKEDREAYDLIASGRMVQLSDPAVAEVKEQVAQEVAAKKEKAPAKK